MSTPKSFIAQKIAEAETPKDLTQIRHMFMGNNMIPHKLQNFYIVSIDFRLHFIKADVHFESLDTGTDPHSHCFRIVKFNSMEGDVPEYYIPKDLGGLRMYTFMFPLNSEIDVSNWKNALKDVYDFVKGSEEDNRFCRIQYAMEYLPMDKEGDYDPNRPMKIYWSFQCYENGKEFGEPFEGVIINEMSKEAKDWFHACFKERHGFYVRNEDFDEDKDDDSDEGTDNDFDEDKDDDFDEDTNNTDDDS